MNITYDRLQVMRLTRNKKALWYGHAISKDSFVVFMAS